MSNDWKPDFTKANPWEGMPADYGGVATFIPTTSNPYPPWEGEPGANIPPYGTPEYGQVAARVVEKAYAAGNTELLNWAKNAFDQGSGVALAPKQSAATAVMLDTPTNGFKIPEGWGTAIIALLGVGILAFTGKKRK